MSNKQLCLIYEYRELSLEELFEKLNKSRNNEYKLISAGKKYITCIYLPKHLTLQLNREQLNWRIEQK